MGERRGRFVAVRVRGGCNNSTIKALDQMVAINERPILSVGVTPSLSPSRLTESQASCGLLTESHANCGGLTLSVPRIGECCNLHV